MDDLPLDLGSWAAFTPSLERTLTDCCLATAVPPAPAEPDGTGGDGSLSAAGAPRVGATDHDNAADGHSGTGRRNGGGGTLLLTAPAPVVDQDGAPPTTLWDRLRGRRPLPPSPEVPGIVLVGRVDGVELTVPTVDARGRALLSTEHAEHLRSLGWQVLADRVRRLVPTASEAAEEVTRALIEVLRVPHPADLDTLLTR